MKSSSWQRISDTVVIKRIDKSFIIHDGTSVPNEFLEFFSSSTLKRGEKRNLVLKYKDIQVKAYVQLNNNENPRARMFWRSSNLSESIQIDYPEFNWASVNSEKYDKDNLPFVSYKKIDGNMILIDIISNDLKGINSSASEGYVPGDAEYEEAARQIVKPRERVLISDIEDQIEKNMKNRGIALNSNWRKS